MLLDEIGARLQSQSLGTVGTDIFLGRLPETPDNGIAIISYPGSEPLHTFGTDNWAGRPRFQVKVRNTSFAAAETKAGQCVTALSFVEVVISGTRYLRCSALQDPFQLSHDQNERAVFAVNFEAWREG